MSLSSLTWEKQTENSWFNINSIIIIAPYHGANVKINCNAIPLPKRMLFCYRILPPVCGDLSEVVTNVRLRTAFRKNSKLLFVRCIMHTWGARYCLYCETGTLQKRYISGHVYRPGQEGCVLNQPNVPHCMHGRWSKTRLLFVRTFSRLSKIRAQACGIFMLN